MVCVCVCVCVGARLSLEEDWFHYADVMSHVELMGF